MKIFLIFLTIFPVFSLSGCDHCIKLCQFNFDYVPMLQEDYCEKDLSCENFLREVSYRYLSGKIQSNPCIRNNFHSDCINFSFEICSQILQNPCSKIFLAPDAEFDGDLKIFEEPPKKSEKFEKNQEKFSQNFENFSKKPEKFKDFFEDIEENNEESEQEIKQEIARQKQKYLRIINRLSELQIGM